ncbi:MAG: DUF1926 domain-containing protein, partial [Planctomycetales bacterium]|nr:DUF1926 domain-containing protein [Planctomycetales bacterium]
EIDIRITKGVTLHAQRSVLEIGYLLEGVPSDRTLHFGIEFNFAGLPSHAGDRYFHQGDANLGHLGSWLSLYDQNELSLTDEWLGLHLNLNFSQPTHLWTFPIESVSQSEGGFELVHQAVTVLPHWHVRGDQDGRWSLSIQLDIDTQLAESRMDAALVASN